MNWISGISDNPFYEFSIILALAALLGAIGRLLKQPLIVMFIALGIIVGPAVLDVVKSPESIHLLAEIGIAVLLFIVGLKLDLRIIRSVGKISLLTGMGQVIFTSLFGYFIGLILGFSSLHSFYIAVALTFSSTIIIVKLLSDKKEIDSLHGQIAIGFLIVQDIVVILVMIILSAMQQDGETSLTGDIIKTVGSGLGLAVFTLIAIKWIVPGLSAFLAKSQELLILFAIAWAVSIAAVSELIGFSSEVGAFLAGITLASSDFKEVISSRLVTLRDFLLLFFFVNLGSNLDLSIIGSQIYPALIFSAFVLIGNPLIVLIIMGILGYRKRTSFLAGLTVAQISEFSLIFAGLGYSVGHITNEVVGLITLVGLITIGLSTYLILYSHQIFKILSPALDIFQRSKNYTEIESIDKEEVYDVVILGLGRFGRRLGEMLEEHSEVRYLGVDFDPVLIAEWKAKGKGIIYGDMEDPDLLEQIPYDRSNIIISTVANTELSQQLKKLLDLNGYTGNYFVTATTEQDYKDLRDFGFDDEHILRPHQMAAATFYEAFLKHNVNKA
ncbi:cation:proton antiporter [Antarcticibacterium flavum]|uniref:Cation:proton antiporter n=1 Tax=Antarcticibacterium flavum TaxID=2058175 RepID=A0A5B7X6L8_9FLAO|nr:MULTISPECIES: cation:proton antiporter [Antarcticibacterium]MCM4159258.1 sodium:proton exchanger [Antarcticibacterium sp. W02-3]QCY71029.1 cation:proton antiporter [Antarcticibacterium flavum]